MKTQLEKALECVVNIYRQYCILDPSDDYLQFKEFRNMMTEQAQPFLKNTTPPSLDQNAYIQQLFKKADKDDSGFLKFTEFLQVLQAALIGAHERSHKLHEEGHGDN
ncbi:protein S100-A8-like [Rhineura floridana]|uniref:protein S100-A8-like n=1 Tax=Rhineura floridana TaxID=261503 RepID=UPI002AC8291E|nr:protein S100-A8-like [Rhineura floridana]